MSQLKKIAYLGEPFSYHYLAANSFFGELNSFTGFESFESIIKSIVENENEFGVLAVNNSIAGDIPGNFNRIAESGLTICGEISLKIQLHLAASLKSTLERIEKVYSHPMVWKETTIFFNKFPHMQFEPVISTATGINFVAQSNDPVIAAIGSKTAILFHNLQIIASNIDDHPNNYTRFLIITNQKNKGETTSAELKSSLLLHPIKPKSDKIRLEDLTGEIILFKRELENGNVYIEIHSSELSQFNNIMREIARETLQIKVLGSYPPGKTELSL